MDRHFFARFISMKSACPFCRSISAVTGGKFANGATTAAIGQAFNGNSFWDKAKELGQLAITLGDGFVPGASLANCALNGGCSYMTWAFAVGEVIGALTGVGVVAWAAKAAYKAFKSGKAVDKIKEIFNNVLGGVDDLPTLEVSRTDMPNIASNIEDAIEQGAPSTLNRITSKTQIRKNRRAALRGHQAAGTGKSLDEYPFASCLQGGSGACVRVVPVAEQNIQGGKISQFYQRNGIGDGDAYKVRVVN